MRHHFYTLRDMIERFTCTTYRKTGVVLIAVCKFAKDARFSRFSFLGDEAKNERAAELFIVIFENSSPNGTFG